MAARYIFEFSGGKLCLDFANTLSRRPTREPVEHFNSYADWLDWARQAGMLTSTEMRSLGQESRRQPGHAQAALQRAVDVREALYRLFAAVAAKDAPPQQDVASFNRALQEAMARPRLAPKARSFVWQWAETGGALIAPLWPVIRSAAELLTSDTLALVRECEAEECGWLFLDTSRNHQRRWCDMRVCGNRNKARRYYQKHR
jgi:predicted RNA-binding Zn ribbon-like protein